MKLMRFYAAGKPREWALADAVGVAASNAGYAFERVAVESYEKPDPDVGVACIWGVKRPSRRFMDEHAAAGIHTLFFDKGYTRRPKDKQTLFRVSANSFQPDYIRGWKKNGNRFRKTGVPFHSPRNDFLESEHILIAGSSQKAHDWFPSIEPGDANAYYRALIGNLRHFTKREIVFRPKPSWRGAMPVPGSKYSVKPQTFEAMLDFCRIVIVTCSGASFHAIAEGLPVYVMPGFDNIANSFIDPYDAVTPFSGNEDWWPRAASDMERWRWCSNVAHTEWSLREFRDGEWLDDLREELA